MEEGGGGIRALLIRPRKPLTITSTSDMCILPSTLLHNLKVKRSENRWKIVVTFFTNMDLNIEVLPSPV